MIITTHTTRCIIFIAITLIAASLACMSAAAQPGHSKPGPQLSGYNWEERWIVAAPSNCTQNTIGGYDTLIWAANTGSAPIEIARIELVGKDADSGMFKLVNGDPSRTITPGERISGTTLDANGKPDSVMVSQNRLYQQVRFTPISEGSYSCAVFLITTQGDTSINMLAGIGIESHARITGQTYGPSRFIAPGDPADVAKPVIITAAPNATTQNKRPLTVTNVRITGPDAADFQFAPGTLNSLPRTLQPNEQWSINVEFHPGSVGCKTAYIQLDGDASLCDHLLDTLRGCTSVDASGVDDAVAHAGYLLEGGAPNPFAATTEIAYRLGSAGGTEVAIYDAMGRLVARLVDGPQSAGEHRVLWDAAGLPDGIYHCRVRSAGWIGTRRMVLAR